MDAPEKSAWAGGDPLRVLFVSPRLPPPGGVATLMEIVVRNGLPGGVRLEVVNTSAPGRAMHAGMTFGFSEIRRNAAIVARLVNALVRFRPDIVHVNSSVAPAGVFRDAIVVRLAKAFGARVVTHYHGSVCAFADAHGPKHAALRQVIAQSHVNIASNSHDLAFIRKRVGPTGTALHVPNFIDPHGWPEPGPRSAARPRPRAIYVGALTPPKGALDIVEVARRRPDIDVVLVSASVVDSFRPVMETLPPNVTMRINLTDEDLRRALQDSDFFLFLSYHEGFPLAVTEAMYAGLPIVATRAGAVPDMVDEGRGGFLCAPGDVSGALSAIDRLIGSARLSEMGRYNYGKARDTFVFDAVAARLVEIYRSTARRSLPSAT